VASDPVVSQLVAALAAEGPRALRAIRKARAAARERAWALAGDRAPGADGNLIPVDIDATIVLAHSEKEKAAPSWKKTFGFHPLGAFADHSAGAGGEAPAILLRAGNAGSNTAAEHIEVTKLALAQLPRKLRRRVLIRADQEGQAQGQWNPAHPARQPGKQAQPGAESDSRPQPQPGKPRSRNIEVSVLPGPGQQMLHPIGGAIPGMLGDRPAVLPEQVSQ
jgi:hypothetical protein